MLNYKIYYVILFLFVASCGEDIDFTNNLNEQDDNTGYLTSELNFMGSDYSLDIITWNIEWYPKDALTNVYLKEIIDSLNIDIIAIQEIADINALINLSNELDDWDYIFGPNHYGQRNGFLVKNTTITYNPVYEILNNVVNEPFTKFPLVLEFTINENNYILINNHLKCCGDGYIDYNNNSDEEFRRLYSMELIKEYIDNNFSESNVIIVGDFNDEIIDQENVFNAFLLDSFNYEFSDLNIAQSSSEYWSYPSYPSHIDHIIISNELFDQHLLTSTILIESALTQISDYNQYISDHRPVGIKLLLEP